MPVIWTMTYAKPEKCEGASSVKASLCGRSISTYEPKYSTSPSARRSRIENSPPTRTSTLAVTAQVGRLNQVCGPAYTEKRRQIPSNSTTGLIREGLPGHARGVPGQLQNNKRCRDGRTGLIPG